MVANFSFVFYLTRPDPRDKAFPMAILPSAQGQATDATISSFSIACQILVDEGIDLRGIAFDGNVTYLQYLDSFATRIDDMQKINLRSPFSRIVPHEGPGIFIENTLHLLKTIQYRFVKDTQYFTLPFVAKPTFNRNAWRSLGMSENLLDDRQTHKQEDELVLEFFQKNYRSGNSSGEV
jgi:hypothetical protein